MARVKCMCGGQARYVGRAMIDQFVCDTCEYKTQTYFDGAEYAQSEWNKRNSEQSNARLSGDRKTV